MEVKFRKATVEDIKVLQDLKYKLLKYEEENLNNLIDPEWFKTDDAAHKFEKEINDPDQTIILAELEGKIVGFVAGEVFKAPPYKRIRIDSELVTIFVEEDYRNMKIGAMLVEEFVQWAKSKNADQVKIEPYYNNEKAIKFYKREGFEDFVIMLRKKL